MKSDVVLKSDFVPRIVSDLRGHNLTFCPFRVAPTPSLRRRVLVPRKVPESRGMGGGAGFPADMTTKWPRGCAVRSMDRVGMGIAGPGCKFRMTSLKMTSHSCAFCCCRSICDWTCRSRCSRAASHSLWSIPNKSSTSRSLATSREARRIPFAPMPRSLWMWLPGTA